MWVGIMKKHTTNYVNALIEVAEDCPVLKAETPPDKNPKSAARIAYEMISDNPYRYTSDDVVYEINGKTKGIGREEFFLKGQPCLRTSALGKRYGWGIHSNGESKIAIFAVESEEYRLLAQDGRIKHVKAMRNGK
jgi:hypothetical protein